MARDSLQYDKMVENALRGVVRQALAAVVSQGLPGNHHFYLTFRTTHPGVEIGGRLLEQYPQEMTIVLQHQFWGLEVTDDFFVVNLTFSNIPERLKVPYGALVSFVDPSVKFGLQFQIEAATPIAGSKSAAAGAPAKEAPALALAPAANPGEKPPAAKAPAAKDSPAAIAAEQPADDGADPTKKAPEKVVSLDAFRKK